MLHCSRIFAIIIYINWTFSLISASSIGFVTQDGSMKSSAATEKYLESKLSLSDPIKMIGIFDNIASNTVNDAFEADFDIKAKGY